MSKNYLLKKALKLYEFKLSANLIPDVKVDDNFCLVSIYMVGAYQLKKKILFSAAHPLNVFLMWIK